MQQGTEQFGATLLLPELHRQAPVHARACFDSLSNLDSIEVWTRLRAEVSKLEHARTHFWMARDNDEQDPYVQPEDFVNETAPGACFRLTHFHDFCPAILAEIHGYEKSACLLAYHRSGFAYFIRDADALYERALNDIASTEAAAIAPLIHPVFAEEPSAHDLIAWTAAVRSDLKELFQATPFEA
jgi:hypothetical protein